MREPLIRLQKISFSMVAQNVGLYIPT